MGKKKEKKEIDKIFKKYYVNYNNEENQFIRKAQIDRQRYLYEQLNKKGLENTNVEKLLDQLTEDIQHQYAIKQDTESKLGYLIALWGLLVAAILQNNMLIKNLNNILSPELEFGYQVANGIAFSGIVITGLLSLILINIALITGSYCKFRFDDKEDHFKCAVDSKNMSMVLLLDINTNVWEVNELANEKKHLIKNILVVTISIFALFIAFSYCM